MLLINNNYVGMGRVRVRVGVGFRVSGAAAHRGGHAEREQACAGGSLSGVDLAQGAALVLVVLEGAPPLAPSAPG